MKKIRFAIAGSGWRALFFVRAAKRLPEWFELTGVLCHSAEKAEAFARKYGVKAFSTLDDLLETKPEFVVSCVNKAGMADMSKELMERGMPVLSETPFGETKEGLIALHETWKRTGTPLGVAEQYFLFPTHQARKAVIERGMLGPVTSCGISMMHEYHAFSMLRWFMGEENGPVTIRSMKMSNPIVVTGGRAGMMTSGEIGEEIRVIAQLEYAGGRTGLYDFSGTQYHSYIRTSHVRILGERGEIFDDEVRWIGEGNLPQMAKLERVCDAQTGTLSAIRLGGETLWQNRFRSDVPMSEDEIAVSETLCGMANLVRDGEHFYPVRFGMRDAYLTTCLKEATESGKPVTTQQMPWDQE